MAINLKPAEGRIVLGRARTTEFFPWYEKAGIITRIAGKRIYYKDGEGNEKFLHEYACIVDTTEEEEALLDFSARGREKVKALKQELADEAIIVAAPTPVRRTRKRS